MKINATVQKLISEFLGSTLFLTAVTAAGASTKAVPQFSIAITLGLAMLVTGQASGAHLNPLVSLFHFSKKNLTGVELAGYLFAQISGALFGAAIGLSIWGAAISSPELGSVPELPILIGEWVITGGWVFLVGYLFATKRAALIGIAVPLWILAGIGFTPSGAQANPAVSIALLIAGDQTIQGAAWIIVAQAIGALTGIIGLALFTAKPSKPAKKVAAAKASNRTKKA